MSLSMVDFLPDLEVPAMLLCAERYGFIPIEFDPNTQATEIWMRVYP